MKSIAELEAIQKKTLDSVNLRKEHEESTWVVVGMATCGIAAGARPVLLKCIEEVQKCGLANVVVSQTGCVDMCGQEPIVQVIRPGEKKVTYVQVREDMVSRIISEHIVNGTPVSDYATGCSECNCQ